MYKKRALVSLFLFLFVVSYPVYSMDSAESPKHLKMLNVSVTDQARNNELKKLTEIKLKIETKKAKVKSLLLYFAQVLKDNNIKNIHMILLSETNLSNNADAGINFDMEVTGDFIGMPFFDALKVVCEKAKLIYYFDGKSIIIGPNEVINKLVK